MDQPPQESPTTRRLRGHEHVRRGDGDLLDEPVLPLLRSLRRNRGGDLSRRRAWGRWRATCSRRTTRSRPGAFPWVTLAREPHWFARHRVSGPADRTRRAPRSRSCAPSSSSASWGAGRPIRRWPSTPRCSPRTETWYVPRLSRRHRRRGARPRCPGPRRRPESHRGMSATLPHSRSCAPRGRSRVASARCSRALLIHHIGLRRGDPLPVGTMIVNASGSLVLGLLTGLSLYHGLGGRTVGDRRGRTLRRLHHVVDRQLGDGPPAPHGPPQRSRHLHPGQPRRVHRLRGSRASRFMALV